MRGYVKVLVGFVCGICFSNLVQQSFREGNNAIDLVDDWLGPSSRALSLASEQKVNNPALNFLQDGFYEKSSFVSMEQVKAATATDRENAAVQKEDAGLSLNEDNMVVALIAFGNATRGIHVQRVIRSARARGEYKGRFVILTDSTDEAYINDLVRDDPLIHVLPPRRQDWEDMAAFKHEKMKIKRFKTLLIEYIDAEPVLDHVQHILYLDVDIIVCQPLLPWLEAKWKQGAHARQHALDENASIMSMFHEGVPKKGTHAAHSGLILLHRTLSHGCVQKWRDYMERYRDKAPRDQWLVRKMRKQQNAGIPCKIPLWWPNAQDFVFPVSRDMEERRFATFVHITNTFRAKRINATLQQAFLEDALKLSPEERRDPKSLAFVPESF